MQREVKKHDNYLKRIAARAEDLKVTKPKSKAPSIDQQMPFVVKSHSQIKRWGMVENFPKPGEVVDDDDEE